MEDKEFEDKMENLTKPNLQGHSTPVELKLTIVNAKRSAAITTWFVVVPAFFLLCVVLKYYFHFNMGFFTAWEDAMANLDKTPGFKWVWPLVLVGLPVAGIIINGLAITHFAYDRSGKSMIVTIKLKWLNLVLLIVSAGVVAVFLLYLITENINHP